MGGTVSMIFMGWNKYLIVSKTFKQEKHFRDIKREILFIFTLVSQSNFFWDNSFSQFSERGIIFEGFFKFLNNFQIFKCFFLKVNSN